MVGFVWFCLVLIVLGWFGTNWFTGWVVLVWIGSDGLVLVGFCWVWLFWVGLVLFDLLGGVFDS